jgi:hypothetical protein
VERKKLKKHGNLCVADLEFLMKTSLLRATPDRFKKLRLSRYFLTGVIA